jgi:hypothetical protein
MIEELVPAQREASAMKASSSSDTTYRPSYMARPDSCLHGAPHLFTSALTPSIVYYLAFMEADGNMDKVENALWRACDSDRFDIPAAPKALEVMEKWGEGSFGVEIHRGRGSSVYIRFGCRVCQKATPTLSDAVKFNQIFDEVFGLDQTTATF